MFTLRRERRWEIDAFTNSRRENYGRRRQSSSVRTTSVSRFQLVLFRRVILFGSQWRRNVGSAGGDVPLAGDFPARQMIFGVENVDPERRERLIKLLDIDLDWSMMALSDGQRRRVQICLGLLKPLRCSCATKSR